MVHKSAYRHYLLGFQNKATVKHVGKIWYKELKKVHRKRKLTLLYLMNDVVQNSRKQCPDFLRVFSSVLTHAMRDCARAADAKVLVSLDRLLRIWHDRHVFEPELLLRCRQALDKFATPRAGGARRRKSASTATTGTTSASTATTAAASTAAADASAELMEEADDRDDDGDDDDDERDLEEEEGDDGSDSGPDGVASPALCDAGVGSDDDDNSHAAGAAAASARVGHGGGNGLAVVDSGVSPSAAAGAMSTTSTLGAGAASALRAELAAQMQLDQQPPVDADSVLAELQFLAAAPSGSAEMRRRISRFPKHIVEEASVEQCRSRRDCQRLLREVAQADEVCADYNSQLAAEVERRRAFHAGLRAFCQAQRAAAAADRARLAGQRARLRELQGLRQELAAHLANLPDLAALPAVAAGLAPLPSVGDLFS